MNSSSVAERMNAVPEFLQGGGDMGQRIREFDWSKTPLGPVETWPQSLRTCIRIMLTSRQPIWIGWGKELIKFYNDPYKAIVGGKHPWALGTPASIVWKDIWKDIEPMLKQVMEKDEGTYVESQLLIMERNGYPEETYYTFSYTPIPGDDGKTEGMFCANTDDTDKIISERQLKTLTQLGKRLADCRSNKEIIQKTIDTLAENPYDFPFALFRSVEKGKAILVHSTELGQASAIVSKEVDLESDDSIAQSIHKALKSRKPELYKGLKENLGEFPKGAWAVSPHDAIILPIIQSGIKEPYGLLIIGLNPYRLFDENYKSFFSLIADQIATSFNDVHLLEEERKRSEALAEIDRAKTIFFSNISHEFRTPLTLLLGPVEDALNDPDTVPENKLRMEVAYRNALRMQRLVNTLLEFSRIEAGRVEGKFAKVDICTLTQDLASTFRSAIEKAGMKLEFDCKDVKDDVYVDVDMWEKIVLNLISNAFKYSKEGTIAVSVTQVGTNIQVSVADTGVGIPEDQLEKIFDRFHRIENIQGRSQEGTGIGLAMVKELVRLHQGSIDVQSKPGAGTIFTVTIAVGKEHLPADKIINEQIISSASNYANAFIQEALRWLPSEEKASGKVINDEPLKDTEAISSVEYKSKVLLADDNADMREYVSRLLSHQFQVITAINGEEAFEKLLQFQPHLLISDVMMPKLDGFGLLKKVRSHAATKNIPVIFLSARAGEEAKVEGLEAGADDYLVKPFSAKELLARVDANIKITKSRIAAENNLRNVILQAPVAMTILKGENFVIEIANEKAVELWGKKHEEVINRPAFEVFPELVLQGFNVILEGVYNSGKAFVANEMPITLIRHARPENIFINFIYEPLRNVRNEVEGIIGVGIDVTSQVLARVQIEKNQQILEEEVKKRTKELNEINQNLQQSNTELQQFAHVASHDLKEPVRKIKTFTSRLIEEGENTFSESGKLYLRKVNAAADRMNSMIEGVLNYSTIKAAQQKFEKVDLNEILTSIESDLEILISQKAATIHYSHLPVIEGASVLLYQLFYNLVNNSLKFSKPNVPCVITISSSVIQKEEKDFAEIKISDNGIGFEQEFAEKIFETFLRLNSKDQFEGTGLGLSLCKRIVERHGGSIQALGEPDKGATFDIVLPIKQKGKNL